MMVINTPLIGPYFLWGGGCWSGTLRFLRFFLGCRFVSFRTFVSFEDLEAEDEEGKKRNWMDLVQDSLTRWWFQIFS